MHQDDAERGWIALMACALLFTLLAMVRCTPSNNAPDASPPAPVPIPPPPAPIDPTCTGACTALALAGCNEGRSPSCAAALSNVQGHLAEPSGRPLTCADLSAVKTAADVRALGQACSPIP
jgi:hypothetical protein